MAKSNNSPHKEELTLSPGLYLIMSDSPCLIVGASVDTAFKRALRLLVMQEETFQLSWSISKPVWGIKPLQLSETPDPVPHEALLSDPKPLTLQEEIARFIGGYFQQTQDHQESLDDAFDLDFDDDDDLPISDYEIGPDAPDDIPAAASTEPVQKTSDDPKQVGSPPPENVSE